MMTITEKIKTICKARNAVILAHNYTVPEVQDSADFVGDSLELSLRAAETTADIIVFCGVHFMAETAKILNPNRLVLMPDTSAGCPMADMAAATTLREFKAKHPGVVVVSYVNTTAAIKAESDICCTSANAQAVVRTIPLSREIIFLPDRNLGNWVQKTLGRPMLMWNGYCSTHQRLLPKHLAETKEKHPTAVVLAHPECRAEILEMADHVASTSGMLAYCRKSNEHEFIIATENGILHRMRIENPNKTFYEASSHMTCPNMKKTTLEKILWCLDEIKGEITVEPSVAEKARLAVERMLNITKTPCNARPD
jgi:quinolinate synthase